MGSYRLFCTSSALEHRCSETHRGRLGHRLYPSRVITDSAYYLLPPCRLSMTKGEITPGLLWFDGRTTARRAVAPAPVRYRAECHATAGTIQPPAPPASRDRRPPPPVSPRPTP